MLQQRQHDVDDSRLTTYDSRLAVEDGHKILDDGRRGDTAAIGGGRIAAAAPPLGDVRPVVMG